MPQHFLPEGRHVIESLTRIGETLGYRPVQEWPIESGPGAAAVDVVWFSEPEQQVPILMFEVESTPSASLSNNAVKVLGKNTSVLLKPLFFFHLIVTGGHESGRVSDAESVFYSHNYRIYLLGNGEAVKFLKDLFEQHRRLRSTLELINVVVQIASDWPGLPLGELLEHVEALEFSTRYLEGYALLSQHVPECNERFFEFLRKAEDTGERNGCGYSRTYLGSEWSRPIHLGLLAHKFAPESNEYFEKLRYWQEKSFYMSQIGPHWGLSMDYDEFIARMSPFLWSLVAALFKQVPAAQQYVCDQMIEILSTIRPDSISLFHAVWLLHIANSCHYQTGFVYGQDWINARSGVGISALFKPPPAVFADDESHWAHQGEIVEVPGMGEFRCQANVAIGVTDVPNPEDIAVEVLVSDVNHQQAQRLVHCLLA